LRAPRSAGAQNFVASDRTRGAALRRRQTLQRSFQQLFKIVCARFALGFAHRAFRGAAVVAQIHQRREHVGFDACRGSCGGLFFDGDGFKFIFQLDDHALGGFAADSWDAREAGDIAGADRGDEFVHVHAGKNFESEGRANAGSAEEQFKKMLFAGGEKSIERESVFADMGVNEQRDFRVEISERGVSGKRDSDEIAHPAYVHEHLVGPFVGKRSAELADHALKVLPPFIRLSTRERGESTGIALLRLSAVRKVPFAPAFSVGSWAKESDRSGMVSVWLQS